MQKVAYHYVVAGRLAYLETIVKRRCVAAFMLATDKMLWLELMRRMANYFGRTLT